MKREVGMIHGRFQPFHLGHLMYLEEAARRCHKLIVGVTNPDAESRCLEPLVPHRHLAESNPFTFHERALMIAESLPDRGFRPPMVCIQRFSILPTEEWGDLLSEGVAQFVRVLTEWEREKASRLEESGFEVVRIPGERLEHRDVTATEVRRLIRSGGDWLARVPAGTARVVRRVVLERQV